SHRSGPPPRRRPVGSGSRSGRPHQPRRPVAPLTTGSPRRPRPRPASSLLIGEIVGQAGTLGDVEGDVARGPVPEDREPGALTDLEQLDARPKVLPRSDGAAVQGRHNAPGERVIFPLDAY